MSERQSQVLSTRIPNEEYALLKSYAAMTELSLNEVIVRALRHYLLRSGPGDLVTMIEETYARFSALIEKLRAVELATAPPKRSARRRAGSSA